MECSVYEDRLKYEGDKIMLPSEKEAHLITGKVQDAILKKEAAIYIRNSYNEMIAIMKKVSALPKEYNNFYFNKKIKTVKLSHDVRIFSFLCSLARLVTE